VTAVPVVHVVTNDEILARHDFIQAAHTVMVTLGARGALHLRGHTTAARRLYDAACALLESERRTTCWLVVNDRVDVACAAGVRAVQVTSRSMTVAAARRVEPNLHVGASVHSVEAAIAAEADGADWYVIGPAFDTETHPGRPGAGEALIAAAAAQTRIPAIAIGGVTVERLSPLRRSGAHGVAVIRGIWHSPNVAEAARRYLSAYDADSGAPRHDKRES
jgi:thiamine-phosphate diphosphorylase